MLKKGPEKALPEYKIKEILSYQDKVKDQAEGAHITTPDHVDDSETKISVEVSKLEDIETDTPKPKKHHQELSDVKKDVEDDGKLKSPQKENEGGYEIETSSLGEEDEEH